jgi:hypothetical protein
MSFYLLPPVVTVIAGIGLGHGLLALVRRTGL